MHCTFTASCGLPYGPHCVSLFHPTVVCSGGSLEALSFSSRGSFTWMAPLQMPVANSAMKLYAWGLGIPQNQVVCMAHWCVYMLWCLDKFPSGPSHQTSTTSQLGDQIANGPGCSSTVTADLLHTAGVVPMLSVQQRNTKFLCVNGGVYCLN